MLNEGQLGGSRPTIRVASLWPVSRLKPDALTKSAGPASSGAMTLSLSDGFPVVPAWDFRRLAGPFICGHDMNQSCLDFRASTILTPKASMPEATRSFRYSSANSAVTLAMCLSTTDLTSATASDDKIWSSKEL